MKAMKVTGASIAASGIQVWKGMAPALPMAPIIIRMKAATARPFGLDRDLGHGQGAGLGPQDADAQDQAEVAQAADDEGFDRGPVGVLPAEGDQAVQGDQKAFPEEDQGDEVVGEHRPVGQGGREEDVGVVFPDPGVVLHLGRRVEGDQERGIRPGREG